MIERCSFSDTQIYKHYIVEFRGISFLICVENFPIRFSREATVFGFLYTKSMPAICRHFAGSQCGFDQAARSCGVLPECSKGGPVLLVVRQCRHAWQLLSAPAFVSTGTPNTNASGGPVLFVFVALDRVNCRIGFSCFSGKTFTDLESRR